MRLPSGLVPLVAAALIGGFHIPQAAAQTARLEAYLQEPKVVSEKGYAGVVRSPAGTLVEDHSIVGRPLGLITEHPVGTTITLTAPKGVYNFTPTVFLGWAPTDHTPETGFAPANTQNPLTITLNADRRLVAYTGTPIAEALNTPDLVWRTGGHALWTGSADVFSPGSGLVARACTLRADGEETFLETDVTGPALVTFNWRLDSATGNVASLEFYVDGSLSATYSPVGDAWKARSFEIPENQTSTLRFRLKRTTTSPLPNFTNPLSHETAYLGDFKVGQRSAPSNLRATPNALSGNGFATIRWNAGFGAEKHLVELSPDPDFGTIAASAELPAPTAEHTFYYLSTTTRYYYRVTARAAGHPDLSTPAPHPSFIPDGRFAQTITFSPLTDLLVDAPAFDLSASASSGLPVTFEIVSGPATLLGKTLTLTGAPGEVLVRATQAGGQQGIYNYAPADPVEQRFHALPLPEEGTDPFTVFLAGADVPEDQRGATDDPDGDGIPNLLEYALGLSPTSSDPDGLPVAEALADTLTLTYIRAEPAAVSYVVESTTELGNPAAWTSVGVDQGTPAGDGLTTASVPLGTDPRFLRLRVTLITP